MNAFTVPWPKNHGLFPMPDFLFHFLPEGCTQLQDWARGKERKGEALQYWMETAASEMIMRTDRAVGIVNVILLLPKGAKVQGGL